jgi:hypothetical protein
MNDEEETVSPYELRGVEANVAGRERYGQVGHREESAIWSGKDAGCKQDLR